MPREGAIAISIYMTLEERLRLEELAKIERRSASAMVMTLVSEALDAREKSK